MKVGLHQGSVLIEMHTLGKFKLMVGNNGENIIVNLKMAALWCLWEMSAGKFY